MNKRVLITGGAEGLGYELAKSYTNQGNHVTILDIKKPNITQNISYISFDLKHFDEKNLNTLINAFDIIICNAGISVSGNFTDIAFEDEEEVFNINTFGHIKLIKYLLKNNLVKKEGRIAFILSASIFFPFPIALSYSASKSSLDGFAYALESYVIAKKISITRIYPGPMNTAHSKYYPGAQTEGGRYPHQSTPAIIRGIEKRKRKICPDPISKLYSVLSILIPRVLCNKAFTFYKDRINLSK